MKKNVSNAVIIILLMCIFTNGIAQVDSISESAKQKVQKRIDEINEILNQKDARWRAGVTSLSYLTEEEFRQLCGEIFDEAQVGSELVKQDSLYQLYKKERNLRKISSIPDWQSLMSDIENQGGCGNCWAHATSGVVEGVLHYY
jgi:C1A family cysteine protease